MSKIKDFILEQIIPGFHAKRANKTVSKFYDDRANFEVDTTDVKGKETEYIEQLKSDLKEQHDRKKIIEDKAKSLLFIIAVSITAITFSLTYLNSISINLSQIVALVFLGISILYFVQGVIKALQTLNIRQFHVIQADVEITQTNFKLSAKKSDEEFLKDLIKSKQQNDLINIRLSNYTFASFNLIRNGIIFFVVFFATTICGNYFSQKDKAKDTYSIRKEIKTTINDTTTLTIPYTFELKYDIRNLEIDKKEKK
jgi:hypothetical protein